jgi:hypothetical protein
MSGKTMAMMIASSWPSTGAGSSYPGLELAALRHPQRNPAQ